MNYSGALVPCGAMVREMLTELMLCLGRTYQLAQLDEFACRHYIARVRSCRSLERIHGFF